MDRLLALMHDTSMGPLLSIKAACELILEGKVDAEQTLELISRIKERAVIMTDTVSVYYSQEKVAFEQAEKKEEQLKKLFADCYEFYKKHGYAKAPTARKLKSMIGGEGE